MFPTTFTSFDGTPIRCWAAAPSSLPAAAKVLLVHGLGAHSESLNLRYLRDHLLAEGFAVYGFDLRGYGRSGGRRAYVDRWEDFREDLRRFVDIVARDGRAPLFVLGVSLGGLIAVNYTLHHSAGIRGLIADAPALDASGVPAWLRRLAAVLSKVAPRLRLEPRLDLARLTRDEEAQRSFNSDPLRQTKMTLRLATEITAAMAETLERLPQLALPLLVLHG